MPLLCRFFLVFSFLCVLFGITTAILYLGIIPNFPRWKLRKNVVLNEHIWINRKSPSVDLQLPDSSADCPNIVSRKEWGARPPKTVTNMTKPGHYAFIHHSVIPDQCFSRAQCIKYVQKIQNFHMDENDLNDIAYSFLLGDDGSIYEGRGWYAVGGHTYGFNSVGLGFCFLGDFRKKLPKPATLALAKKLLECSVEKKGIEVNYVLRGHRDMNRTITECPGQMLYDVIRKWPHY